MVHDQGERLAFRVPTGEGDDRQPVWQRAPALWGPLCGDRGYGSQALHDALVVHGLQLSPLMRRTRQPRLRRRGDRVLLRKRCLIETSNDQRKHIIQIEHSRPRSLPGLMVHLVGGLRASTVQPKKPSLGLWRGESGLPVVV